MSNAENEERISRCKREIAEYEKDERDGYHYSGPHESYIRARKEELYKLTTPPEQRIVDAQKRIDYMSHDGLVIFDAMKNLGIASAEQEIAEAKAEITGVNKETSAPVKNNFLGSQIVQQGDTRGLRSAGLHTPTMQEILANANKRDPTQPYFDTNSDVPSLVDPLAQHPDFSGEVPRMVNPLKPNTKIGGPS